MWVGGPEGWGRGCGPASSSSLEHGGGGRDVGGGVSAAYVGRGPGVGVFPAPRIDHGGRGDGGGRVQGALWGWTPGAKLTMTRPRAECVACVAVVGGMCVCVCVLQHGPAKRTRIRHACCRWDVPTGCKESPGGGGGGRSRRIGEATGEHSRRACLKACTAPTRRQRRRRWCRGLCPRPPRSAPAAQGRPRPATAAAP